MQNHNHQSGGVYECTLTEYDVTGHTHKHVASVHEQEPPPTPPPDGYFISQVSSLSHADANKKCKEMGRGSLVNIYGQDEYDYVLKRLSSRVCQDMHVSGVAIFRKCYADVRIGPVPASGAGPCLYLKYTNEIHQWGPWRYANGSCGATATGGYPTVWMCEEHHHAPVPVVG